MSELKKYGRADTAGNKICRDDIEIGVKVQPEDEATAQLMEGVLNTDGYLHICKDDVLVLRTDSVLAKPHREEFEENMSEKLGVKVVLIDRAIEVVGGGGAWRVMLK